MKQGFINGGQVSGLISDIPTVKELLDGMIRDAQDALSRSLDGIKSI